MIPNQREIEIFKQPHLLNSCWLSRHYIDWSFLKSYGTSKFYKKGEIIDKDFEPSDAIYYIAKGRVRSSVFNEEGEEKIIMVVDEGNILNTISVIDSLPNYFIITTVTDCLIYKIKKEIFLDLMKTNPEINMKVILDITRKARVLISHIEDMTFMSATARIAKCLYRLCFEYGIPHKNGIKLNIKFTHQEMAIYVGTCRVTASNILENMEKMGIISKENGYVIVRDINKLQQIINHLK